MKKVVFIILLFSLFACKPHKKEEALVIPDGIIARDSMVMILKDIHLIEAGIRIDPDRKRKSVDYAGIYYNHLFRKYPYSYKVFDSSMKFYQSHTREFNLIYEDVITELSKLKTPD